MSRKLVIPGAAFTGPKLSPDPILTTGSLVLLDVTHPANPWPTAPLTNGQKVPNLADKFARSTVDPAAVSGAFDAPMFVPAGTPTGQGRSSKGALAVRHLATAVGVHILFPLPILAHLIANKAHTFYYSLWGGVNFRSGSGLGGYVSIASASSVQSSNAVFYAMTGTAASNAISGTVLNTVNQTAEAPFRVAAAFTGHTGTSDQTPAQSSTQSRIFGRQQPNPTPSATGQEMLFQRYYLEDLTVSGRSPAQVAALDATRYAALVTATGGRYAGDTSYGVQVASA